MNRYIYILTIFIFTTYCNIYAQDLHFSQYFNAPLLVNPANTGFMPDHDYRLGINYRDQWANIGNAYKTMSAWGDVQLFNSRFENGWVGLGGTLLKDDAGGGTLTATRLFVSTAYHQVINDNGLLSVGVGIGGVNKRVDPSKLTFDNQWNGKFFDITVPNNEPFNYTSVYYLDLQLGVNYAAFLTDNLYVNAGASIQHLNQPSESFFASNAITSGRLAPRYTFFVNAHIKYGNLAIVNPNVYYSKMGTVTETVLGANVNYNLSGEGGANQLILGLYYRAGDAIIPMIGYQVNDLKITFNYDATTSALGVYNGTQGAYEVSVMKNGIFGADKSIKCPKMVRF
ncbi:MAG: PorP/SprF family type IX secretion system membrane protein [Sphingobacteriia bacterium]|nr:PorP/SprF family type IX secretion system membrane protein [Sphingobacteriia bacterium]